MFIPDGFKPAVIDFLDSPPGKALMIALRARKPAPPSSGDTAHGMIQRYANAEGFEMAIDALQRIPHESEGPQSETDRDPFHVQKD